MWESTCTYVHMYVLAMCLGTCMCSTFSQSRSSTKRVNANSLLCVIRRVFSYRIFFFYYVIYTYNMCIYVCIHTFISNYSVCLFSQQCVLHIVATVLLSLCITHFFTYIPTFICIYVPQLNLFV